MQMLTKPKRAEEQQNWHDFPATRAEYAKQYPLPSRFLHAMYAEKFAETAFLKNPLKTRAVIMFHLGRPAQEHPDYQRWKKEYVFVRIVIEPGETRELPAPFADVAHVVDGDLNVVVSGHAPALRRLEKDASGQLQDITPPLHASLMDSLPDDSPTKPRAKRR